MVAVLELESHEVFTLQPDEIEKHWWWIEPLLERIEDRGWESSDVLSLLVQGKSQLWGCLGQLGPTAVWVTSIEHLGGSKYGLVWLCAGEPINEITRLFRKYTEPWLKEHGCKWVEIVGRKGWAKVLPDFHENSRVFVKELR